MEDDARWKLRKEEEIFQILAKEEDIRRKRYNQELNDWRLEQERLGREMILQEEDMKRQEVEEKVSKMKHDQEFALKAELEWYVEDRRRKGIEADERWKKDQMDGLIARLDQEEEQKLRINQEQDLSHRLAKEENLRLKLLAEEEQRWHQLQQAEIILKVEKESDLRQKLQEEETRRRQKLQEEENNRWQATQENENKVWKQQKLKESLHFFKTEEDLRQNLIVNLNGVTHEPHSNYTHGLRPDRQLNMISKYIYNDEFTGLGIEDEKTEKFKFDTKLSGVITKEFCENHPFFGRIYHDIMVCNHWKTEGKIWSFEKFILHLYELLTKWLKSGSDNKFEWYDQFLYDKFKIGQEGHQYTLEFLVTWKKFFYKSLEIRLVYLLLDSTHFRDAIKFLLLAKKTIAQMKDFENNKKIYSYSADGMFLHHQDIIDFCGKIFGNSSDSRKLLAWLETESEQIRQLK